MKHSNIFIVNPITIAYLLLALIFNRFNFIFLHYGIAFIHEFCHFLMAKALKIKVDEMQFLPIGFYIKIKNLEQNSFIKQFLVLIAGPLSFFISFAILKLLLNLNLISEYGNQDGCLSNQFILLFNLLPIYPLDGAKIVELFLSPFINEYKLRVCRICISIITLVVTSSYMLSLGEIITVIFLLVGIISSLINLKKEYIYFLICRLNEKSIRKVRVVSKKEIYRLNDNYCLMNNRLIGEKEIIQDIIAKQKIKDEI